jgi:enoyl-CoA hydratase/carnithine racemase
MAAPEPIVIAERREHVGVARLNRPDARNALSAELMTTLREIVEAWDHDPDVRAIVIAGSDDWFAAGADIKAMRERSFQETLVTPSVEFWDRMNAIRTPLVAAVSGYALGGGCELALLCDMIVASETAEFGQPEIMLGIIPGAGGTQRLARTVGKQRAMELVLTGRRIDAQEAHRLGLVNRVTKKKEVQAAGETGLRAGLDHERRLYEIAMGTDDRVEGMDAFVEKRKPDFKGR